MRIKFRKYFTAVPIERLPDLVSSTASSRTIFIKASKPLKIPEILRLQLI
jgi:hypothetical protein